MWQIALLQEAEPGGDWWRVLLPLATLAASALAYQQQQGRRRAILDDPNVTRGLSAEQRLRLELGLLETSPAEGGEPLIYLALDDRREVNAAVRDALEQSRLRERGDLQQLKPAEQAALRRRLDAILRARWEQLAENLAQLARDPAATTWAALLSAGADGVLHQLADLDAELRAARSQPTYPPIALQLEGPVLTLRDVLSHARKAVAPDTDAATAQSLRQSVLHFLSEQLPVICDNIEDTADDEHPRPEPAVQRELVIGGELTNQDLPST